MGASVTVTIVRASKVGVKVGIVGSGVSVRVGRGVDEGDTLGEGDIVGDGMLGLGVTPPEAPTVWVAAGAEQAVRNNAKKKRKKIFGMGKLAPD